MADLERELRIKATADTAAAKTEVASLNETVEANAAATVASAGAADVRTAALERETAAEFTLEANLKNQQILLRELNAAQSAAATSVERMGAAAAAGGKLYEVAIAGAGAAVVRLEIAQEAVRSRGGPVSPAAIANLAAYDAAVRSASLATEQHAGTYQNLSANLSVAQGHLSGFGRAAVTAGEGVGILGRALQFLAGPVGLVLAAIALLPQALALFAEYAKKGAEAAVGLFSELGQGTKVVDAHGKAVEALDPKYKSLAEAQDALARAQNAARDGVIQSTDDLKRLSAEFVVHTAALHGATAETAQFLAAAKLLGIKLPETFDSIKASAQGFLELYQARLKTGALAAREFAEDNETLLNRIFAKYVKLGQDIPPELKKIADSIGFVSKAESELAKNDDLQKKTAEKVSDLKQKYADLEKALTDSAKSFKEHSDAIEKNRKAATAAIEATTAATIKSLQAEIKANEDAHNARTISDTKYFENVNRLIAQEATAKQKAYEAEKALDEKAVKDKVDLEEKFKAEQRKRKEALDDTRVAEEAAEGRLKSLNAERFNEITALAAVRPHLFDAGIAAEDLDGKVESLAGNTKAATSATVDFSDVLINIGPGMHGAAEAAQVLEAQLTRVAAAARDAAAAVASVVTGPGPSSGGGGGGGY